MTWSAGQYTAFETERTRPVRDLLAAIPKHDVRTAIDLGCGPGNSTEVLATRFRGAAICGIDTSEDMLAAARKRLPGVRFDLVDIESWSRDGEPVDLILANASLQWVPGHDRLFPALLAKLKPGGDLAVQMPDNLDEPAHRLMREVADDGPWASKLRSAAADRAAIGTASSYLDILDSAGAACEIWRTTYHHVLAGVDAVVEWFKGSGLRPFLAPLSEDERHAFLARYRAGLGNAYSLDGRGRVLLPFPRLFIIARHDP